MKQITSTLIILIMLAITPVAMASTDGPLKTKEVKESALPASFIQQIYSSVSYPDFAREQKLEGFVVISFGFDESGNFLLNEMNSSNDQLSAYVLEKMQNLKLCVHARQPGNDFNFRFEFTLL